MEQNSTPKGRARGFLQQSTTQAQQPGHSNFRATPAPSTPAWGKSTQGPTASADQGRARTVSMAVDVNTVGGQSGSAWTSKPTTKQQTPSTNVKEIEQGIQKMSMPSTTDVDSSDRGNSRSISNDFLVQSRPTHIITKQGTMGTKTVVQANYFSTHELSCKGGLNQYRVDFTPDVVTSIKKFIISRNKEKLNGGYIFDGSSLFTCKSFENFKFITTSNSNEVIEVKIKFVGTVQMVDPQWLQIYNLIMRRSMTSLQLQLIGRNLFDAMQKIDVRDFNLEIWPGYITSFRQHERDILLCCDLKYKVMRHDTVLSIIKQKFSQSQQTFNRIDFQTLCRTELLGSIVLTDYNNKTYRIDDIDFDSSPRSSFPTNNGNVTYLEYYRKRYNIKIVDPDQPLLISKPMERQRRSLGDQLIKLIPELCRATGLSDEMTSNYKLMRTVANHTRLNPEQRINRLREFQRRLTSTQESRSVLDEYNLKIDEKLIEIPARILPEPTVVFGEKQIKSSEWNNFFKFGSVYQGFEFKNWFVVAPKGTNEEVTNFIHKLTEVGSKMKLIFRPPKLEFLAQDNNLGYSKILEKVCQQDPLIIMVIVKTNRGDLYGCIKKKTTIDRAVPTQIMRVQTIKKSEGLTSIATKVAIQMGAKISVAPWTVSMPNNVMCIGFDVCHSTRDRNKSYGALVATMDVNKKPGTYFSAVSEHVKGNEMSNDIALNVIKALRQYQEQHGQLPTFIFFYRDGVGEGQLHQIYEHEVNHVKMTIEQIYNTSNKMNQCRLAYIVVSKRINTRIFNNNKNPAPGTVVDDCITLPHRYDFYLISQSVNQGTVSPTSYNVLFDSTRLSADRIQDLSYRQTHLYYNWCGTVRVPAVCQYAHKLAFLVGQYLHQSPNPMMEKCLYYL